MNPDKVILLIRNDSLGSILHDIQPHASRKKSDNTSNSVRKVLEDDSVVKSKLLPSRLSSIPVLLCIWTNCLNSLFYFVLFIPLYSLGYSRNSDIGQKRITV